MKEKKTYLLFIVLLSVFAFVLAGCGGGGGEAPPPGPPGPPGPPRPTTSSVLILGSVGSAGVASAGIAKAQATIENPLANAIVEILAYDKNNRETDSATITTSSRGTFTTHVELSNSGGYIVVNVKKTGFADYSKRIDFDSPSDVNIAAILDTVLTAIATRDNAVFSASTGKKVMKIGIFKTVKGQKIVKVGRDVDIRKQQGNNPILEIEIPTDSIPPDTNTLVANLNTFDPITDALRFPGQYRDSNGNRIVSLGFDYINITDDKGMNLGALTKQAIKKGRLTKAQATGTYLRRWIGQASCNTLLKDYCTGSASDDSLCNGLTTEEKAGFNVPVYTYNPVNGTWVMLGVGTLDKNNDEIIDSNDVISTDLTNDGKIDEKDYQKQCTTNGGEYLRILVTNEDFLANWWNLDYPLIFEEPKELCIEKTFVDQDNKPIEGVYVYLYDDDSSASFAYTWGVTDSSGKVKLKTILTDNSDTDRYATLEYWDWINYQYGTEAVTLGDSPNCTSKVNTITKEATCQVEGHVRDETGAGLAGQYVNIYSTTSFYWNYAYTDSTGYFIMDAKCNEDQQVYAGWSWTAFGTFNPNGTVDHTYEEADNGTKVTLYDIILENQAPYAYGWLSSTSIFAGDTITAYIYGWDNECDKPLSWQIKDKDNVSLASGQWNDCWGYIEQSLKFDLLGTYNLNLYVTDSKGKRGTAVLGTVSVSETTANRPPVITNAYPSKYVAKEAETITLYGSAYDLDGDNLSWQWYADSTALTGCSGTNGSSITTTCSYTTPSAEGVVTIKFEVSDGNSLVSQEFEVSVGVPSSIGIIIQ